MSVLLQRLWNFEYSEFKPWHYWVLPAIIALVGIGYVLAEVAFGLHPEAASYTFIDFWKDLTNPTHMAVKELTLEAIFPQLWLAMVLFAVVVRIAIIISGYLIGKQQLGEQGFAHYFFTYFSSFLAGFGVGIVAVFVLSVMLWAAGINIQLGANALANGMDALHGFMDAHVPNLIHIKSYWLALLVTVLLSGLPLYFVHWLSHKSRLVWLVFHRAHHCPQYLHPLAAPPAFVFDFLLVIPFGLVAMVVSKIVYTEPLIMEMALWFTLGYSIEIFNHSIGHYKFAYNNFLVRNLSRLYGDRGVYHLVHHSAIPGDEMINLSSGPLQLWDRLFGTYRAPYKNPPPVGLTNNPIIKMNPFRIILSGVAQLAYEWRQNKDFATRFKIIFGDIYYMPPVTKDFLIIGYQNQE